jgi:hypothetical protein
VAPHQDNAALWAAIALCYLGIMIFLGWAFARRRKQQATVHVVPPEVNTRRVALYEWLQQERIVRAMIQSRTATRSELHVTFLGIPAMSLPQLESTCESLLRDKNVRRVIAAYMVKKYGMDLGELTKELTAWANPVPERRTA